MKMKEISLKDKLENQISLVEIELGTLRELIEDIN